MKSCTVRVIPDLPNGTFTTTPPIYTMLDTPCSPQSRRYKVNATGAGAPAVLSANCPSAVFACATGPGMLRICLTRPPDPLRGLEVGQVLWRTHGRVSPAVRRGCAHGERRAHDRHHHFRLSPQRSRRLPRPDHSPVLRVCLRRALHDDGAAACGAVERGA